MNILEWCNKINGTGFREESATTPSTLQAELSNRQLDRPVVFDPALRQFTAHRAGEPRFQSDDEKSLWHYCRMAVMHHILRSVSRSEMREHLLLRGSAVMAAWFGERARRPGDLDWVIVPSTWTQQHKNAQRLLKELLHLIEGSNVNDEIVIPLDAHVIEEIWTYERVPGIRVIVPWQHANAIHNGTVQMDFVFGEEVPTPPLTMFVSIDGFASIALQAASPEQSLAWKLLWLTTDSYALGKDLYDAVLLAESHHISAHTLITTFKADSQNGEWATRHFHRKMMQEWHIEWDDFVKEYPDIGGTAQDWKNRLTDALGPLFAELELL